MRPRVAVLALPVVFAVAEGGLQGLGAERGDAARAFLAAQFQLGDADFGNLDRGRSVARTLDTVEGREVATLGAIRIAVPAAFYAAQLRNVVEFKKSAAVLQIGVFSQPARIDDLAGLTLDARDVESLSRCRTGDCNVQLSTEALERFRQDVPWHTPAAGAAASRVMREVLVDLVNAYRASGDPALMTYTDASRPLSLADEFRSMVAARPAVLERFPNLYQHLLAFPHANQADISDLVYWSKEKMGPAVIITVTHLAIARLGDAPAGFAAASKQIYGSHYFDSSLGVTVLVDDSTNGASGTYLVYVNRSRIDALGGLWGGVKRLVVRSRTRATMGSSLVEARNLVERRFRAQTTATR